MEKLDQTYLNNLVSKARQGSSNAFAELFMAAYKRHLIYLSYMYDDSADLNDALKDTYVRILKNLPGLSENAVVPAAILEKVFDECGRRMVKSSRKFSLSRKCLRRSPRMRIRNRVR